jgi:nitroreductase
MLKDLVRTSRSYRRFYQDVLVDVKTLRELVDLARLAPTGSNKQPLRFMLSNEPDKNAAIFPHLRWAGYLKDWPGPAEGERPSAYIAVLGDTAIRKEFGCDHGIAAQTIMLGAAEKGLGGCIIASLDKRGLRELLAIPERYEILLVLALGKPKEKVVIDEIGPDGDVKYWREPDGTHHVPKRRLEDIILT